MIIVSVKKLMIIYPFISKTIKARYLYQTMIPEKLLQVFKDYKDYPVLQLNQMNRDYIDNIYPEQMESSLMKGIDAYNRPFVAIKLFPRDLYEKILREYYENHESCLTLVALARTKYFPPDIARHICNFMEYRSFSDYNNYYSHNKITEGGCKLLSLKEFLKNQISVHTIFQRYTITGLERSPFVHAENSELCLARYRWKMLDINTLLLLSNGEWSSGDGAYDPELELTSLIQGSHSKALIYNEKIELLINGFLS